MPTQAMEHRDEPTSTRAGKWVVGFAAAGVLAIVLAVPFAFSMFALVPLGVLAAAVALIYITWRQWRVLHRLEEVDDGSHVELVGGSELRRRDGAPQEADRAGTLSRDPSHGPDAHA